MGAQGEITLRRAGPSDGEQLWALQRAAFLPLLEKYRDDDTSPAAQPLEGLLEKMERPGSVFFFILLDGEPVGGLCTARREEGVRLSPLFILPEYQDRGYAQRAMALAEQLYPPGERWFLDTISQEAKLCHLYEKMGYRRYGEEKPLQEGMTLVHYEKFTKNMERMSEHGSL